MKIIRNEYDLPKNWSGTSITIGSFNFFHEGHHKLVFDCVKYAKKSNIPSMLVTFEVYKKPPILAIEKYASYANSLRKRFLALKDLGIDYLLLLRLSKSLVSMPATLFLRKVLFQGLKTRVLIIGDDFQFGRMRLGDASLLYAARDTYSLQTIKKPTLTYKNERISSSRVRFYAKNSAFYLKKTILGKF